MLEFLKNNFVILTFENGLLKFSNGEIVIYGSKEVDNDLRENEFVLSIYDLLNLM